MYLFLAVILVLCAGAFLSLLAGTRPWANVVGALASVLAGILGLAAGLAGLFLANWNLKLPWQVPMGSFHLAMDGLSAFFVCVVSLICGLAGLYGGSYLKIYGNRKNIGVSWFFYLLLFASMLLVLTARNGVLFLAAWEVMSLASFFLVVFEAEQPGVLDAGWTYLIATHLGTAFLLVMFLLLGHGGSLEFDTMTAPAGSAGVVFLLGLIGFGTKAGFLPLHVWLPEAHPAAPSHVSAVMSGVMIKTGIYGVLRLLTMLGPPPAWWGWTLIGVGAVSGIIGVLFALAQHDLKRLLAYSSVENIGIIALGIGLGLLGVSSGHATMAVLGFSGGLLHVLNHAIFKSLLFLGAGSVIHATGTGQIDRLGGLMKRMGSTATTFLIAAAAICGLPPLNGFVSEFLIYFASLTSLMDGNRAVAWGGIIAIGSLALIGGLAAACFAKAFGMIFLGEPRDARAAEAHEAAWPMRLSMWLLATLCVVLGLSGPLVAYAIQPAVRLLTVGAQTELPGNPLSILWWITGGAGALTILVLILVMLRRVLLRGRTIGHTVTWDCGYAAPSPRMQYTASSFAMPIIGMFRLILRSRQEQHKPQDLFPTSWHIETHTDDVFTESGYRPVFRAVAWVADHLKWLQQGRNQLYVLYIALAAMALLVWVLGVHP